MPLINSASGKISVILVVDSNPNKLSVAITDTLARETGAMVHYLLLAPANARRGGYHGVLPGSLVKKLVVYEKPVKPAAQLKKLETDDSEKLLGYITDLVLSCSATTGKQNVLYFDRETFGFAASELGKFLPAFNVCFVPHADQDPHFFPGGDFIAGDDFLLIGHKLVADLSGHMSRAGYWDNFFLYHQYKEVIPRVLVLNYKTKENDRYNSVLYHLDLYLTYLGSEQGKPSFLLAEIVPDRVSGLADTPKAREAADFLEDVLAQLNIFFNGQVMIRRIPLFLYKDVHPMTYNNGLVESKSGGNVYYMPEYVLENVPEPDAQKAIAESMHQCKQIVEGCFGLVKTIPIPDNYLITYRQSLHCIAAVLQRS